MVGSQHDAATVMHHRERQEECKEECEHKGNWILTKKREKARAALVTGRWCSIRSNSDVALCNATSIPVAPHLHRHRVRPRKLHAQTPLQRRVPLRRRVVRGTAKRTRGRPGPSLQLLLQRQILAEYFYWSHNTAISLAYGYGIESDGIHALLPNSTSKSPACTMATASARACRPRSPSQTSSISGSGIWSLTSPPSITS